ncbi:MAG TPA: biotin/lipoyl-binding protein, partial [Burkholderiaceae bacterium]|nr:biotin/lipoyl-binding protein [Burkholderiaceae bacterium]
MALVIEEQPKAQAARPPKRAAKSISGSAMIVKYVLPVIALGLLVFAVYYVTNTQAAPNSVEPPVQPAKAPFDNTVAAAGMIEPRSEDINIGSPVPGLVVEVFVEEEERVKKGRPLFRLDDRQLQAELIVRNAALKSAEAQLSQLEHEPRKERIPVAKAQVTEAEANLADQRDQLERTQELYKRGGVATEQDLIARRTAYRAADAKLARAKAEFDLLMAGAWQYEKEAA